MENSVKIAKIKKPLLVPSFNEETQEKKLLLSFYLEIEGGYETSLSFPLKEEALATLMLILGVTSFDKFEGTYCKIKVENNLVKHIANALADVTTDDRHWINVFGEEDKKSEE